MPTGEPIQQRASKIIKNLAKAYVKTFKLYDVGQINMGYCFHFAANVKRLIPKATLVDTTDEIPNGAHTLIKLDGRYYDAEMPEGTTDPSQIPLFRRHHVTERHLVEYDEPYNPPSNSWRNYWHENGSYFERAEHSRKLRLSSTYKQLAAVALA